MFFSKFSLPQGSLHWNGYCVCGLFWSFITWGQILSARFIFVTIDWDKDFPNSLIHRFDFKKIVYLFCLVVRRVLLCWIFFGGISSSLDELEILFRFLRFIDWGCFSSSLEELASFWSFWESSSVDEAELISESSSFFSFCLRRTLRRLLLYWFLFIRSISSEDSGR